MMRALSAAALLCALSAPVHAIEAPRFLRAPRALSLDAPMSATVRDDVSTRLSVGASALLADFVGTPQAAVATTSTASAALFLVTAKNGIEGCFDVTVELYRLTGNDERIPVASGSVTTSILPRKQATAPIIVPLTVQGTLAGVGERIGMSVLARNRCSSARNVTLLYDGAGAASSLAFSDAPPPPPPGSPTTSTTSTTSTTLAPPASCLDAPMAGFEALTCQLDSLEAALRTNPASAVGGNRALRRQLVRLARTRALVLAASSGDRAGARLRRAQRKLDAFAVTVAVGLRRGRVTGDLGVLLDGLASRAVAELRALRSSVP
jgi:hypothetical protein